MSNNNNNNNINNNNNNNNKQPSSSTPLDVNATKYYYFTTPKSSLFIICFIFIIGFGLSLFILFIVHNPIFFIIFFLFSTIVATFMLWNFICFQRHVSLFIFLRAFPLSDLRSAQHGQLIKITGPVLCGDVSLESSYERVARCVYTSTLLYDYEGFGLKALNVKEPCFLWKLAYSERFSTDFYISDKNSGIRTLVKAGCGCRIVPLIAENQLVYTKEDRVMSPNLTKWLRDRNLSANSRVIRLEEGYVKEGDSATVIGILHKGGDDISMVVQPPELISTGCSWRKLLLPVDFDGLLIGVL